MTAPILALGAGVAVLLWPRRDTWSPRRHLPPTRQPRWWAGIWPHSSPSPLGSASPGRSPGGILDRLARRRRRVASPDAGDVADALVLLALALRGGMGLAEALREVQVGSQGRVRRDLAAVVAALQWARSVPEAWAFASPGWREVAQAWEVAVQTGSAPAEQVERVAHRLREAQERDRERRAARAGVLLVLPLGFGFLPAFVCTAVVPVVLAVASGVVSG